MKPYVILDYPNYKLNYWPIPKCANTATRHCLEAPVIKKLPNPNSKQKWVYRDDRSHYIELQEAKQNGYKNFTVVRHPYDRFISLYKDFVLRRPFTFVKALNRTISPEEFIELIIEKNPVDTLEVNEHIRSMSWYITDANGFLLVDKVIDTKDLNSFIIELGIQPRIVNQTDDTKIKLTKRTRKLIRTRYKSDFALLDYTK